MGRKKTHPIRSGGISEVPSASSSRADQENNINSETQDAANDCENEKRFYVEVNESSWGPDEHFDVAEIVLNVVEFADETTQIRLMEEFKGKLRSSLRFSLYGVDEGSFRLGHWPILPSDCIVLEKVALQEDNNSEDSNKAAILFFSGIFDGPTDGVSGLVHLINQKLLTLRVLDEDGESFNISCMKVRVEMLRSAFDACESLLEITRQPWKKSMMNVMTWLRPEVLGSEAIYNINRSELEVFKVDEEATGNAGLGKQAGFDAAGFYEAIKPSRDEPVLDLELPGLLAHLRPYQQRAAYWMVEREKGVVDSSGKKILNSVTAPFCVPVTSLEGNLRLFYNPFSGSVSLYPESPSLYISGGILADEMGLGKTVELLACIFSHRRQSVDANGIPEDDTQDMKSQIKRQKRERVECICGAASENPRYKGLWVQCDICDAWQHGDCVGFSPKKKKVSGRKGSSIIMESDGSFICSLCFELMEAVKVKTSTGATLIVCPATIMAQWHSEIRRHTRPGSLKICIYEGAKNFTSTATLRNEMNELASADIVLTTYDVLKEDLSHDSDRHEGDRRFMRFQKRYPVIPTVLTRLHWWRICLDEAQMVECNTASVTEMAIRLSAQHRWCITGTPIQRKLDDIYGLLRFLRASPFDVYRWWVEVIRDPYERRDLVAMKFIQRYFRQIMWRSSKLHVSEELQLPSQEECRLWLTFSPIEEYFYQKQHETCVVHAHAVIRSCRDDIHQRKSSDDSLSHKEVEKLLFPLLKLRQACCHPQVGSSGLCSLHHSPLSMGEILDVLIGKTKVEGEEALRIIVVALNGLAGIAIIEEENARAVSLYKEALTLADENCSDFRLDPLLSIHILHNLAQLLPLTSEHLPHCPLMGSHSSEDNEKLKTSNPGKFDRYYVKRRKISGDNKPTSTATDKPTSHMSTISENGDRPIECDDHFKVFSRCYNEGCLKKTCANIQQKYLSLFISKLAVSQQDFRNSYMQVSTMSNECKSENMTWWLQTLDIVEESKDSSEELLRKIDLAVSSVAASSRTVKISSRVKSITGLKYTIQTGLDSLETSRQAVINRILEIDQTMEKPRVVDIERKRYCPNCNNGTGSLCINCELDQLFQIYEAGLFLVKKAKTGAVIASEDAIAIQKQKAALNRFFRETDMSTKDNVGDELNRQRHVREDIQVSKSPSPLEITLGVIRSFSKKILGREGAASSRKQLLLFEAMRKEYVQARSLSVAQSQLLGAHDEIIMSTTRMRLKETEDEASSITVLCREELTVNQLQYLSDKQCTLTKLAGIKGQLRYLKGLIVSNQKVQNTHIDSLGKSEDTDDLSNSSPSAEKSKCDSNTDEEEPCPICHENLGNSKMMFLCGHVVCCKCCLKMMEKADEKFGKSKQKWIMCPTCRQRTDTEQIAYVDEEKDKRGTPTTSNAFQVQDLSESSIAVCGSYGTKIEAITRRILWITSTDQEAKVLVFSSWNDVLDVLSHSLDANNISYVRMKGGRKSQDAISKFKGLKGSIRNGRDVEEKIRESRPIRVLLMLIQHGANGLNILEAQHVILVEPLLNPAAEAQAISRVHRVGQEKKTFVHRFIVKNSVEESIYKLNQSRRLSSVIGTKAKNKHQHVFTLQEVESLFPMNFPTENSEEAEEVLRPNFSHLPPGVAAGVAAERRLMESRNNSA